MAVNLQPHLVGSLVELRPLRDDDFGDLFAVAADPLIWEQHPASDRYRETVFRDFFRDAMASGGAFLVLDVASQRVIGSSRFADHNPSAREIEIGWTFLARSHWGGRHNGEMKRLMIDHALTFVDTLVFHVGLHNIRSQKAVERIGAERDGPLLEAAGRQSVVFRLTRERWRTHGRQT